MLLVCLYLIQFTLVDYPCVSISHTLYISRHSLCVHISYNLHQLTFLVCPYHINLHQLTILVCPYHIQFTLVDIPCVSISHKFTLVDNSCVSISHTMYTSRYSLCVHITYNLHQLTILVCPYLIQFTLVDNSCVSISHTIYIS